MLWFAKLYRVKSHMGLLEVRNISVSFGGLKALKNVDVVIDKGEIVGLIGPNGAGKTTLFNVINGYIKPDCGKVYLNAKDITGLPPFKLCKEGIGRTFQIVRTFNNLTALENVIAGCFANESNFKKAKENAVKLLEIVGLADKSDILVESLTLVERKKVELARALATKPTILLLDEFLAGLSSKEMDVLLKLIKKLNSDGLTVLMIEHIMEAVMSVSDRVVVLNFGEKIAEGSPEEIRANKKVIDAYLGEGIRA